MQHHQCAWAAGAPTAPLMAVGWAVPACVTVPLFCTAVCLLMEGLHPATFLLMSLPLISQDCAAINDCSQKYFKKLFFQIPGQRCLLAYCIITSAFLPFLFSFGIQFILFMFGRVLVVLDLMPFITLGTALSLLTPTLLLFLLNCSQPWQISFSSSYSELRSCLGQRCSNCTKRSNLLNRTVIFSYSPSCILTPCLHFWELVCVKFLFSLNSTTMFKAFLP